MINANKSDYRKEYYKENKERIKQKTSYYRKMNPAKRASLNARYRTSKINRTPAWADLEEILDVYQEAKYFSMVVDHIIPLQGRLVSGLHVRENLQLLTNEQNCSKGNKFNPIDFDDNI